MIPSRFLFCCFFISVLMGIINAYFPIERLRNYLVAHKMYGVAVCIGFHFRSHYSVLLLFVHSLVYRLCKRWYSFGSDVCLSDYFSAGERGSGGYVPRLFWTESHTYLCHQRYSAGSDRRFLCSVACIFHLT
mgnify:CR=1 FL=1